jgi:rod shape-determining protein MreD
MRPIHLASAGLAAFWLQVTLAPHLSVFDVRPNLLLLTVILLGIRWVHPGLYLYAALAGIAVDSFSHGLLGVYGISFLVTGALANLAGLLIYEQNALFVMAAVLALSLAEGLVSLMVLQSVGSEVAGIGWFFGATVPLALYHALLTPFILWGLRRVQHWSRFLPLSG